jgi:hypothetical protein
MAIIDPLDHDREDVKKLGDILLASPILRPVFRQWSAISLPDCWLAAGAVAQTVWNAAFGFTPDHGLADVGLVYFDATYLSEAAEAGHANWISGSEWK